MSTAVKESGFFRYWKAALFPRRYEARSPSAYLRWAASPQVMVLGFELLGTTDWRKPLAPIVMDIAQYFDVDQVQMTLRNREGSGVPIVLTALGDTVQAQSSIHSDPLHYERRSANGLSLEVDIWTQNSDQSDMFLSMTEHLITIMARAMIESNRAASDIRQSHESMTRELHDSVAQQLGYISLTAASVEKRLVSRPTESQLPLVREMRSGLEQVQRQVREIIAGVRLSLDAPSLSQALEASLSEYGRRSSIIFELDNRLADSTLSQEVAMQILQIAREGLANVVRHSHAQFARLSLLRKDNQVTVVIEDNGQGFDRDLTVENHYGLMIMQERARTIGATMHIESSLGSGTRLTVNLPMGVP